MHISWTKLVITLFFFSWTSETRSINWQVGNFFKASITASTARHVFDVFKNEESKKLIIPNLFCSIVGSALISTLLYEEKHGINYLPFLRNKKTRTLKKLLIATIYIALQNGFKQNYRDNTFIEFFSKQLTINILPFFCAVTHINVLLENPLEIFLNQKKKAD